MSRMKSLRSGVAEGAPVGERDSMLTAGLRLRGNDEDSPFLPGERPDVDLRRLDADRRQRGGDLAAVIRAMVDRLCEPNAKRRVTVRPVIAMANEDRVRIRVIADERRPCLAVANGR